MTATAPRHATIMTPPISPDRPADTIVTTFAFQHLPGFWKGTALPRLYDTLKRGAGTLTPEDSLCQGRSTMGRAKRPGQ